MNVYRLAVAEQDVIVLSKAYSLALNGILSHSHYSLCSSFIHWCIIYYARLIAKM